MPALGVEGDLQIRGQGHVQGKVRQQFILNCTSVSFNYDQPSTTTSNTLLSPL